MNAIKRNEKNNQFYVSSKNSYLKDNNKTARWVGRAKWKPLDTYGFSKRKNVDDVQASLTGTTFEQSASGRKNNPIFYKKLKNKKLKRQILK